MEVDDFLAHGLDSDDGEDNSSSEDDKAPKPAKTKATKHKGSLHNLEKSDPEFYEFLKNEDKELLDFEPDSEEDSDEDEEDSDEEKAEVLELPTKLEVASDDSDEEEMETESTGEDKTKAKVPGKSRPLLTIKVINQWAEELQQRASDGQQRAPREMFSEVVAAFTSAVQQMGSGESTGGGCKYRVEGSAVFNAIVRLCLTQLLPVLNTHLHLKKPDEGKKAQLPSNSNKWKVMRAPVKTYLSALLALLPEMNEAAVLNALLKHVHQMALYFACFPPLARALTKRLVSIWSSSDETSRVLAFLTLHKIVTTLTAMLEPLMKSMYLAYVKNCKFTSPTTLPLINFMQTSLVEVYAMDSHLTYQYAFIYMRQLAIHLRNAITTKKKDTCQAVYNWQCLHSLSLWAKVLSSLAPQASSLQPLIYPLTQTIIGTIQLMPTARYFPLRFHCVRALNLLASSTDTYIPTLPVLLEVFQMTDFNKKHKSLSFKPINFACVLKLSQAQLTEKSFRDGVVDQLYEHVVTSLHTHAHTLAFPELSLTTVLALKQFCKQCKVANYTRQMKQILEKIAENGKVIEQRRRTAALSLADTEAVRTWERRSLEEGTPLGKFYTTYRKLRDREQMAELAGKERISTDSLPTIDRPRGPRVASTEERKEFSELFASDSEDDDDAVRFLPKEERPRKKQKLSDDEEGSDDSQDYEDFDDDELAQLAASASDDDDDDEDNDDGDEKDGGEEDNDDDKKDGDNAEESDGSDSDKDDDENDSKDVEDKGDIVQDFRLSDIDSD